MWYSNTAAFYGIIFFHYKLTSDVTKGIVPYINNIKHYIDSDFIYRKSISYSFYEYR